MPISIFKVFKEICQNIISANVSGYMYMVRKSEGLLNLRSIKQLITKQMFQPEGLQQLH